MMAVIGFGGALWSFWGLIRLAIALRDKNGPGLQASIWQMCGGFGVIAAANLFKKVSFDYVLVAEFLVSASKLGVLGGILFSLWGVFILAESLRNMNSPLIENGIWQIVGGVLISYASGLLNKIIIGIGITNA